MSRSVAVVAHSHWDREWYAPFEAYRARLVSMLDGLIELLETDPGFAQFHLDGQTALVDDYLEVRPEAAARTARLVAAGRLAPGPWYVLMDEFCVSGETVVRNLQLGLARSTALGASPSVGYLPDMFGHMAQMPQILSLAGIGHAVVWRGVPAAVKKTAFWWEAPDGSRVRAEYLPVGYANGASLPDSSAALVRRIAAHETEIESFVEPGWPILLMNGGDHRLPDPRLPGLLQAANASQDRFRFEQTSLSAYAAAAPTVGLETWQGELRSGARAPVLMGVLSCRVDIKQAAAAAEALLEKLAEPLAAIWLPAPMWPGELLERAWLELIRNSAHDSVCGCSADQVGRAVLHRYDNASALAGQVLDRAVGLAGMAPSRRGEMVLNSLPFARSGLVEVMRSPSGGTAPGVAGAPPGSIQVLESIPPGSEERTGRGRDLARLLGELTAGGWLAPGGAVSGVAVRGADGGGLEIDLEHDPAGRPGLASASAMAEAWARAGAAADRPLVVRARRRAADRVLVATGPVPGCGWKVLDPIVSGGPVPVRSATEGGISLDNGLLRIDFQPSGTFSLDGVGGQNLMEEEPDHGDTYNFSPPRPSRRHSDPATVSMELTEAGPLRAAVTVRRGYEWSAPAEVVSRVELHAGERLVRITTEFDHHGANHRVRAVFPLRSAVHETHAECAFGSVERTGAEGGRLEEALATFPSKRFVTAGDLTVTHQGLLEYELLPGGAALAITLLRATGLISRPDPAARPNIAGPPLALRDAQMPGPQVFRYALAPGCDDPWELADHVWTPLLPTVSAGGGPLPHAGSRLRVEGARVSAIHRSGGELELRMFNPTGQEASVSIEGHSGRLVDLRGRELGRWSGSFRLRPWQIATARLDAVSLDAASLDADP